MTLELEEFADQIEELLDNVQSIVDSELPKLKGTQRVEVQL